MLVFAYELITSKNIGFALDSWRYSAKQKMSLAAWLEHTGQEHSRLYYPVKAFESILSGYVGLAQNDGDEFVKAEDDDPFYVCAEFANGRHIPPPIILAWEDDHTWQRPSGGYLQQLFILVAAALRPMAYIRARRECQEYCEWYFADASRAGAAAASVL